MKSSGFSQSEARGRAGASEEAAPRTETSGLNKEAAKSASSFKWQARACPDNEFETQPLEHAMSAFATRIRPHVQAELDASAAAEREGFADLAFHHLERAHVLAQPATRQHVRVHWRMFRFASRQRRPGEAFGQVLRMLLAVPLTIVGLLPTGNSGGSAVNGFLPMPVPADLQRVIDAARGGSGGRAGIEVPRRRVRPLRFIRATLWSLALAGVTLVGLSTACASSQPTSAAAGSRAGSPEAMAPHHARFHRDRPVVAVIAENSGTELVDFVVPYGVLARSGVAEVVAVATREGAVTMRPALQIQPQATIAQFDARFPEGADYVIVPFMVKRKDPVLLGWIKAQADKGSTMVSICDGAMVLAEAGLLHRRRATAHWASESMRRGMYRQTQWVNNARYVVDGPVASSAGISAALPISLAIVEAIAGHDVAATVAGTLGATDWSPSHDSDRFSSKRGALLDALSTMQIANRLFHSTQRVGIHVMPGVDEITLALTADAYSRTGRSQAFAMSDAPVSTRHGLTILPARINGAAPRIDVMLPAFDTTPPARVLDQALAGITTRYGRGTAYQVAAAFEYAGFRQ